MSHVAILRTKDTGEWKEYLRQIPHKDIVHYPEFVRIYEEYGDGSSECFVFQDGKRLLLYPYIRRPLCRLPFANRTFAQYDDIINPYCYGGFVHNVLNVAEAEEFVTAFRSEFESYATHTGIVAEFVRFHPCLQNQSDCEGLEKTVHCNNVIVDLELDDQQLLQQCRRSYRNCIRQSIRRGLELRHDASYRSLSEFAELYRISMVRHGQQGYLNFTEDYFRILAECVPEHLLLFSAHFEGKVAAAALFLRFGDRVEYFLAASDPDLHFVFPMHFLIHKVSCWSRGCGAKMLHLGGGADSLMFFKRGFSSLTLPFSLGKKIHNHAVYSELAGVRRQQLGGMTAVDSSYFPVYRYGLD